MSNPLSTVLTKKDRTREEIRLAILRIEKGRTKIVEKERKLSIIAVAEEAGITAAAIHNHYPDMADLIRRKLGVDMREQRNNIAQKFKDSRITNKGLRDEIAELKKEIVLLASHNATLMLKNSELTAIVCGFHAIRTLSPPTSGHSFHAHSDRQSERSDAGLHC